MAPVRDQARLRWVRAAPAPANCNQPELEATETKPGPPCFDPCSVPPSAPPTQLLRRAPALEKRLPDYCAVSTFVYLLTTEGYNFNSRSFPSIAFQKKVGAARAPPRPAVSVRSLAEKPGRSDGPTQERPTREGAGWEPQWLGGSSGRWKSLS